MNSQDYRSLASELSSLLALQSKPLAITFSQRVPANVPLYQSRAPEATPDGRTGKVSAGCVFWMKAADRTFTTLPQDHGNCSVGSVTHGLKTLQEVADKADVAALLESGWVKMEMMPGIPVVKQRPNYITYGPLEDTTVDPDVVFLRINAKQAMVMSSAVDGLRYEGKPQCHIIPIAKEQKQVAVSVGCMLSRVRTGMSNTEMTCAIPAERLAEVVQGLRNACKADGAAAIYASDDARRFQ
ncbi:MAG TPA: DUF169 domain-containing protein [Burkholderiales bacterium]|nr:DUF169 domain-containing protein [Burkholderiales bacterium]